MLTIIGVGHVFDIKAGVRSAILKRAPKVVALELDAGRFYALTHPEEGGGRPPLLYGILALTQRRLADDYGTTAGSEMLAAAQAARECGAGLALIDRDARAVFGEVMRIPLKEKVQIAVAIVGSLFVSRRRVDEEMERYKASEGDYLREFASEFPALMKVLVDDRNAVMADALRKLEKEHGSVIAVVGDGHVPGICERVADLSPEVIRLKDVEAMKDDNASFSMSLSATDFNP